MSQVTQVPFATKISECFVIKTNTTFTVFMFGVPYNYDQIQFPFSFFQYASDLVKNRYDALTLLAKYACI